NPDGSSIDQMAAESGGRVIWRGPRTGYFLLRYADQVAADSALAQLTADPPVLEATRSYVASGNGVGTTPGLMERQWNLWGMGLNPFQDPGDAFGVRIGLLDTGIAFENYSDALATYAQAPDLAGSRFAAGYDFVHGDAHANDDQGHGTHIADIIA